MGITFKTEIKKDLVEDMLRGIVNKMNSFRAPLKEGVGLLKQESEKNMDQQGRLYGGGGGRGVWKPLVASTKRQRQKLGFGSPSGARPILERTGKLRRNFSPYRISAKSGALRNNIRYAKWNHFGTRSGIPARHIVGSTDKSRRAIGLVFANYIVGKIITGFKV